jgi:hypothetical protein
MRLGFKPVFFAFLFFGLGDFVMKVNHFLSAILLGVVCVFGGSVAEASLEVTLSAGAASTTIMDGGLGDADGLANSIININTIVGGYEFRLTLAESNDPGTLGLAFINAGTNSITDMGGGATTVSVFASSDGFTSPSTPPAINAFSSATANLLPTTGSGNTASVSYEAVVDGTLVGSGSDILTFPGDASASLSDSDLITSLGGTYTISLLLEAVLDNAGSSIDLDGQVTLSPVPEPASFLVWGALGLASIAAGRRNRNQL